MRSHDIHRNHFPFKVQQAMATGGSMVTCLPVQLDGRDWESAIFFQLAGKESATDLKLIRERNRPLPLSIETDLLERDNGTVVLLRLEVFARANDPLAGEILLLPGGAEAHFEVLDLLAKQPHLSWFFGDHKYRIVHSQAHPLSEEQRTEFAALRDDALKRDAIIRMTGRYDAQAAFASVVANYDLREHHR